MRTYQCGFCVLYAICRELIKYELQYTRVLNVESKPISTHTPTLTYTLPSSFLSRHGFLLSFFPLAHPRVPLPPSFSIIPQASVILLLATSLRILDTLLFGCVTITLILCICECVCVLFFFLPICYGTFPITIFYTLYLICSGLKNYIQIRLNSLYLTLSWVLFFSPRSLVFLRTNVSILYFPFFFFYFYLPLSSFFSISALELYDFLQILKYNYEKLKSLPLCADSFIHN